MSPPPRRASTLIGLNYSLINSQHPGWPYDASGCFRCCISAVFHRETMQKVKNISYSKHRYRRGVQVSWSIRKCWLNFGGEVDFLVSQYNFRCVVAEKPKNVHVFCLLPSWRLGKRLGWFPFILWLNFVKPVEKSAGQGFIPSFSRLFSAYKIVRFDSQSFVSEILCAIPGCSRSRMCNNKFVSKDVGKSTWSWDWFFGDVRFFFRKFSKKSVENFHFFLYMFLLWFGSPFVFLWLSITSQLGTGRQAFQDVVFLGKWFILFGKRMWGMPDRFIFSANAHSKTGSRILATNHLR